MKKLIFLLALMPLLTLWSACNKDDDSPAGSKNEFVLNGATYELAKGFIEEYGNNGNNSFDFDILLTSSTINYSDSNQEFNGIGDYIYFDLNSSSEAGLVNGTYNFTSTRGAFALVDGSVGTNYDILQETGEDFNVQGGSVEVDSDGNETILTWELTISNGTTVTGEFRGILRPL